jgi:hypothetical protein
VFVELGSSATKRAIEALATARPRLLGSRPSRRKSASLRHFLPIALVDRGVSIP